MCEPAYVQLYTPGSKQVELGIRQHQSFVFTYLAGFAHLSALPLSRQLHYPADCYCLQALLDEFGYWTTGWNGMPLL